MGQVGHADSKMTMDVYAQLQQRVKREHGMTFDRLVDEARQQLYGTERPAPSDSGAGCLGHGIGHEHSECQLRVLQEPLRSRKTDSFAGRLWNGETRTRTGDTTIFSETKPL